MRQIASLFLVLLCLVPAVAAELPTTRYSQPQPGQQVAQNAVGFDYFLYLPKEYDQRDDWPLVIFLHGAGARDLGHSIQNGTLPGRVERGSHFPFVLVSPFYNNKWWSSDELIVFVDAVAARYKVDLSRIYVTGLSMGGYGTWELASRYPDRFAAALPICGGGTERLAGRLKDVPVWAFHGALDGTVPLSESQKMVDALKAAGGDVQLTVLPKAAHVSWPEVYRRSDVYDWLLSHRRATPAAIDRQAEAAYALRQNVHVSFGPLLSSGESVGRIATEMVVSNGLETAIDISGTLSAGAMRIGRPNFRLAVEPGESERMPFEIDGEAVSLESNPTVEARWTAVVRGGSLEMSFRRILPVSRVMACGRARGTIEIDGRLDDWSGPWIEVSSAKGKASTQASMALAYDDGYVYFAGRVVDDVVKASAGKGVWEQDGLEVRFDFRPAPREGVGRDWVEVLPVLVSPLDDPNKPVLWKAEDFPEGLRVASRRTPDGYETEIAVPMAYVKEKLNGAPLEQFKANLCVNDLDAKGPMTRTWWQTDWRREAGDTGAGTFRISRQGAQ